MGNYELIEELNNYIFERIFKPDPNSNEMYDFIEENVLFVDDPNPQDQWVKALWKYLRWYEIKGTTKFVPHKYGDGFVQIQDYNAENLRPIVFQYGIQAPFTTVTEKKLYLKEDIQLETARLQVEKAFDVKGAVTVEFVIANIHVYEGMELEGFGTVRVDTPLHDIMALLKADTATVVLKSVLFDGDFVNAEKAYFTDKAGISLANILREIREKKPLDNVENRPRRDWKKILKTFGRYALAIGVGVGTGIITSLVLGPVAGYLLEDLVLLQSE